MSYCHDLYDYQQAVITIRRQLPGRYDDAFKQDLSKRQARGLLARNVSAVLNRAYDSVLALIPPASLNDCGSEGSQKLVDMLLKPLEGITDDLVTYAVHKHRTSCAMSNFVDEHQPDQEYIIGVLQQTSQEWLAFRHRLERQLMMHPA